MTEQRLETMRAYWCPRCGTRKRMHLRDRDGGMWAHVKCPVCGCKFDIRTQIQDKFLDECKKARRSVSGLSDTGRLRLAEVLSKVEDEEDE